MTFLTAAALLAVAPVAGADPGDHGKGPPEFTLDHPGIQRAIAAQEAVTGELMAQAAILGTAVTVTEDGEPAVLVLINADDLKMADTIASLPRHVQGVALRVQVTDKIIPMPAKVPAGKPEKPEPVSHTDPQTRPIQLGTSGGWIYDLANGYCCGGTLGALIDIDGEQYILSNYHILEGIFSWVPII